MVSGKGTCKTLKQIRKQIADANGIPFETTECTYEGECSGTCPKCEAELRALDAALDEKRKNGEEITIPDIEIPEASCSAEAADPNRLRKASRKDPGLRGKMILPPKEELRGDVPFVQPDPEPLSGQIKPPPEMFIRPVRVPAEPDEAHEQLMGKFPEPPETPPDEEEPELIGEVCEPDSGPEVSRSEAGEKTETLPPVIMGGITKEPPKKLSIFQRIAFFFRRKK